MSEKLNYAHVRNFLLALASRVVQSKDELNDMDAACGDGDFGTGMYLGFKAALNAVEELQSEDIGTLLTAAGQSILSSTGGASGPLFGTFFIEAGRAVKGKNELDLSDLTTMLDMSMQKIQARGGAKVGDKTVIDALEPAVASLRASAESDVAVPLALEKAAEAAKQGFESTKHLIAKHGKARYLGAQTLGHADPGACVIALILETLAASCGTKPQD